MSALLQQYEEGILSGRSAGNEKAKLGLMWQSKEKEEEENLTCFCKPRLADQMCQGKKHVSKLSACIIKMTIGDLYCTRVHGLHTCNCGAKQVTKLQTQMLTAAGDQHKDASHMGR